MEKKRKMMIKKELKSLKNKCRYHMKVVMGRGSQAAVLKAQRNIDSKWFAIKCTERAFVKTPNYELNAKRWDNTKLEL